MKTASKIAAVSFAFASLIAAPAFAAPLKVSANVPKSCSISADELKFGDYNSGQDSDAQSNLSVTCTNGTTGTISLDQGGNPANGSNPADPKRQMTAGSNHYLLYDLYSDSGRTIKWGADAAAVNSSGDGTSKTLTVYGRIGQGQNNPFAGSYNDTVTATVTF